MRVARERVRGDNRYASRVDLRFPATLREVGTAFKFTVDIVDLSMTGFRCETVSRVAVGQHVSVTIPGLAPLEGRVAWVDGCRFGCKFENALHVAVFDHIAAQFKAQR